MARFGATARFGAVVTAMVTPFDDEGRLDIAAATQLARWLADHGSDGLVVAGTTGEGSVLSDDEKLDLWRAVSEAVTIPVVAGTGSNDTAHSVELTRRAAGCGVAGVLVVTPYYNRPSQAGIEGHFRAVAAASTLPMLIYDIPVRTGRKVSHDVLVRLAHEVPTVVGVKDAASDVAASARLVAATPEGFELYSGNDDLTLALLAVGAIGVVGVATHWAGPHFAEMIAAFAKGDALRARDVNAMLFDSYAFETGDAAPNPIPAKAMMRVLGLPVGQCRLPMGPAPEGLEDRARQVLAGLAGDSGAPRA
jgi:4-hydroxy-tetrahydrodipicolinate synthase